MYSLSFKRIAHSVSAIVFVSGLIAFAMPIEAKAADELADAKLNEATSTSWRVVGFIAENKSWSIRCKMVSSSDILRLGSEPSQQLRFNDQDNSCLHLLASELVFTIDRQLNVTLSRVANISHYKGAFPWSEKAHETKLLSEDRVQLSCRQHVQTVFGFVNPIGMRTLDCISAPESSIKLQIRFADSAIWIR